MRRVVAIAVLLGALAGGGAARAQPPTPITQSPSKGQFPAFTGRSFTPQPISAQDAPVVPRHPFMAPNDRSNLHDDGYQSDTAEFPGPLGRDMETLSTAQGTPGADCASITFDSRGRLETICVGLQRPFLALFDPRTLERLAVMDLPPRQLGGGGGSVFTDFAGGGYFYLDNLDRAVIPTTTRHVLVVAQTGGGTGFAVQRDYDLSPRLASDDKIISALPDWRGLLWFATTRGVVGTVHPGSGEIRTLDTREPIGNSFAVEDDGGVYIVTDGALYRFDAGTQGEPTISWREVYENVGIVKPGQTERGSGTTPTVMGRDYVSITDNADPMNVVVYRRARSLAGSRLVCRQPVFSRGASATDQSLIATARSMVVENNYGYQGPQTTIGGSTTPGLWRVDIDGDGRGCHVAWRSDEIAPTAVPKLSLNSGLVYTYTKQPDPLLDDPWYLTAIDFRTGETVYKRLAGKGLGYNNNYAPITLGPEGTAYIGVLGGLALLRDRVPPPHVSRGGAPSIAGRPRLALGLRGLGPPRPRTRVGRRAPAFTGRVRRCARRDVTAVLAGPDRPLVARVRWRLGARRAVVRTRSPLRPLVIRRRGLRSGRSYVLRSTATLSDGRQRTLLRSFRAC